MEQASIPVENNSNGNISLFWKSCLPQDIGFILGDEDYLSHCSLFSSGKVPL
jgi:hypothetical protein